MGGHIHFLVGERSRDKRGLNLLVLFFLAISLSLTPPLTLNLNQAYAAEDSGSGDPNGQRPDESPEDFERRRKEEAEEALKALAKAALAADKQNKDALKELEGLGDIAGNSRALDDVQSLLDKVNSGEVTRDQFLNEAKKIMSEDDAKALLNNQEAAFRSLGEAAEASGATEAAKDLTSRADKIAAANGSGGGASRSDPGTRTDNDTGAEPLYDPKPAATPEKTPTDTAVAGAEEARARSSYYRGIQRDAANNMLDQLREDGLITDKQKEAWKDWSVDKIRNAVTNAQTQRLNGLQSQIQNKLRLAGRLEAFGDDFDQLRAARLRREATQLQQQFGDTIDRLKRGLGDGQLTNNDRNILNKEIDQFTKTLAELRKDPVRNAAQIREMEKALGEMLAIQRSDSATQAAIRTAEAAPRNLANAVAAIDEQNAALNLAENGRGKGGGGGGGGSGGSGGGESQGESAGGASAGSGGGESAGGEGSSDISDQFENSDEFFQQAQEQLQNQDQDNPAKEFLTQKKEENGVLDKMFQTLLGGFFGAGQDSKNPGGLEPNALTSVGQISVPTVTVPNLNGGGTGGGTTGGNGTGGEGLSGAVVDAGNRRDQPGSGQAPFSLVSADQNFVPRARIPDAVRRKGGVVGNSGGYGTNVPGYRSPGFADQVDSFAVAPSERSQLALRFPLQRPTSTEDIANHIAIQKVFEVDKQKVRGSTRVSRQVELKETPKVSAPKVFAAKAGAVHRKPASTNTSIGTSNGQKKHFKK